MLEGSFTEKNHSPSIEPDNFLASLGPNFRGGISTDISTDVSTDISTDIGTDVSTDARKCHAKRFVIRLNNTF